MRRRLILIAPLWAITLLAGSLMPIPLKVALGTSADHKFIHSVTHIVAFAVFAFLLGSLTTTRFGLGLSLLAAISFGLLLEVLEVFFFHNPFEWSDIRLDSFGGILGFLACAALAWPRPQTSSPD